MPRVFLGLGSNIDAEANLQLAIRELRSRFGDLQLSRVYRSAAVGFDGDDFLNLVAAFDTDQPPRELLRQFEDVHSLIDLLLYGDLVEPEAPLRLPRNDVLEHSFVLGPLAEIAPDFVHPVTGLTINEHWRRFDAVNHPLTPVDLAL
jgi:2-amino-4-hydroxy-6-hydroxymethyldihydropteridine diphosphokinase